jgi:hypothetical protein
MTPVTPGLFDSGINSHHRKASTGRNQSNNTSEEGEKRAMSDGDIRTILVSGDNTPDAVQLTAAERDALEVAIVEKLTVDHVTFAELDRIKDFRGDHAIRLDTIDHRHVAAGRKGTERYQQ